MKLTVAGCSPAWPNPGGAQSGYLLEGPSGRLLLDCGPGVLPRLREAEGWPRVDAIAISHFHLDHWGDLVPWVWGSMYGPGHEAPTPELWLPPGGIDTLRKFGASFGTNTMWDRAFHLQEYAPEEPFTAAGFQLIALRVPHYDVLTFGFRVSNNGATLAYSGDSAPSEQLVELARDVDLFVCEATLSAAGEPAERGHLSAEEAVAVYEPSGARRLLLTHRPAELDLPAGLEQAHDGLEIEV